MIARDKQLLQQALADRAIDPTAAQLAMAPSDLTLKPPPSSARQSAVMLLFYPLNERPHLVFARRPDYLRHHPGQIAFPGGRHENGESFLETALRETEEELGVPAQAIDIIGDLRPVYVPPSNFVVHPFAGWLDTRPRFVPDADEVDQLLEIPLDHFFDPANRGLENRVFNQITWPIPFYRYGKHKIWGATATILSEMVERVEKTL